MFEQDAKGPLPTDSGSMQPRPGRSSEMWRSAYNRQGARAVLLNELRLQGGIACALQLVVMMVLPGIFYTQFYSLDSRLIPIPIATWVIAGVTCALGVGGLVLLRSLLLGIHVVVSLAMGAALGAIHTGSYLLMEDRCNRAQSSFLGCSASSASSCGCAATDSCTRAHLRTTACTSCQAWPTELCAKATGGFLPYMGLILLLSLAAPAVFSLVVLMRLEKSHSDLASRVMYGRALVLRELERLQSGASPPGLDPQLLTHWMATLLRHGGAGDRGPVRAVCEALRVQPEALEVEWRDVEARGGGRLRASIGSPSSFAAGPSPYPPVSRGRQAGAPAAATTAAPSATSGGAAVLPASINTAPEPPPPTASLAAAAAAAAGVDRPATALAQGWFPQPVPAPQLPTTTTTTIATTTAAAVVKAGSGSGLRPGGAAPVGLPPSPPTLQAGGGSSTRQASFLWQKVELSSEPEIGPVGAGEAAVAVAVAVAGSRRGSRLLSRNGSSSAAAAGVSTGASVPQAPRNLGSYGTNAWGEDGGGGSRGGGGGRGGGGVVQEASRSKRIGETIREARDEGEEEEEQEEDGIEHGRGGGAEEGEAAQRVGAGSARLAAGAGGSTSGWGRDKTAAAAASTAADGGGGSSSSPRVLVSATAGGPRKNQVSPAAAPEAGPEPEFGFGFEPLEAGGGGSGSGFGSGNMEIHGAAEDTPVVPLQLPYKAPGEKEQEEVEVVVERKEEVHEVVEDVKRVSLDEEPEVRPGRHFKTPKSLSRARSRKQVV